jgi:trigger factor
MADFLQAWGYENEGEAREDLRAQLETERNQMTERAKQAQVEEYLLEKTDLDLPQDFSARQTARAVMRRIVDFQQRGVPQSDIEAHIDELRTSAKEEVARDLKLGFVLEKVADELGVAVTDEEVNTEIARMAQMYNRRFDRIRDDLQGRGLLNQLVEQIRHGKCVALLLEDAKFVAAKSDEKKQAKPAAKKQTKKKTAKKTTKKTTKKKSAKKKD